MYYRQANLKATAWLSHRDWRRRRAASGNSGCHGITVPGQCDSDHSTSDSDHSTSDSQTTLKLVAVAPTGHWHAGGREMSWSRVAASASESSPALASPARRQTPTDEQALLGPASESESAVTVGGRRRSAGRPGPGHQPHGRRGRHGRGPRQSEFKYCYGLRDEGLGHMLKC